jgi:hypothetical protein
MPVVVLIEVEASEVVIGGSKMGRQANHLAVFLDGCGDILPLLCGLGLRIELLHLWSDFRILRVCRNQNAGSTERQRDK